MSTTRTNHIELQNQQNDNENGRRLCCSKPNNHFKQRRSIRFFKRAASMVFNRGGNSSENASSTSLGRMNMPSASSTKGRESNQRRTGSKSGDVAAAASPNNGASPTGRNNPRKSLGSVSRRQRQPQASYHRKTSPRKSPTNNDRVPKGMDNYGTSNSTPIGLNGPTQFEFSPSVVNENTNQSEQRYLSFLSCPNAMNSSRASSPIRSVGGGNNNSSEKRLCVMDLRPFYKTVELANEQRKKDRQHEKGKKDVFQDKIAESEHEQTHEIINSMHITDYENNTKNNSSIINIDNDEGQKMIEPITDPNLLLNDHVCHLLNTSLPLNRTDDFQTHPQSPTVSPNTYNSSNDKRRAISPVNGNLEVNEKMSLEERLRRERQRLHSNGITQFGWMSMDMEQENSLAAPESSNHNIPSKPIDSTSSISASNRNSTYKRIKSKNNKDSIRILVPLRGNIYVQDGVGHNVSSPLRLLYDKTMLEGYISNKSTQKIKGEARRSKGRGGKKSTSAAASIVGRDAGAIDPQLSPDGSMVAFVVAGEIYVMSCGDEYETKVTMPYEKEDDFEEDGDGYQMSDDGRNDNDCKRDSYTNGDDEIMADTPIANTNHKNAEANEFIDFRERRKPRRVTFGAMIESSEESFHGLDDDDSSSEDEGQSVQRKKYGRSITHGLADFVAQEEMDRYRGFWWDEESNGILFVKVDESCVPPYRITHQGKDGIPGDEASYEDHRYPFAGESNPEVSLGYVPIDRGLILLGKEQSKRTTMGKGNNRDGIVGAMSDEDINDINDINEEEIEDEFSKSMWEQVKWFHPPQQASEYLARVNWLPCGSACIQWQDRHQSKLILVKIDIHTGESVILHEEESEIWINLHHMFHVLPKPIHPSDCLRQERKNSKTKTLQKGSFSFLFASERTGYCHLYLYTYIPGDLGATLLRAVSSGEWVVESIVGVDMDNDAVYVTGTYDSPLERHLYMLPLKGKYMDKSESSSGGLGVRKGFKQVLNTFSNTSKWQSMGGYTHAPAVNTDSPPNPIRLTKERGMHSVVMDKNCCLFVDTCSDLNRPPSSKVFSIADVPSGEINLLFVLYDASKDVKGDSMSLPPPQLLSLTTSDGSETLHAALYTPDPMVHGSGPYPLICAVYGGPHVQRVNRSWNQCVDMRAQRLISLGFVVVKCDNRGSSRRGLAFEATIKNNLGRFEVLDQIAVVRHLVMKRIADPSNVGIYGWSYGGYLSAMCLCRAPDVFKVAIAGAPVTSWDGYDTHYTERYMGLPKENSSGYQESAVFNHIPNMRGKLMIIHGLIDENVHFRHTARLINRLVSSGKDYDLLIFPDERHSPRRLRDRVYMERRMNEYFVQHLLADSKNKPREYLLGHL